LSDSICVSVSYDPRICQVDPQLITRRIKPRVDAALEDTPVVVIVGPRQCGKSTLAEVIAHERGAHQVTLDDARLRAAANADPTGFIERFEELTVIDEFQKAPELLPAIKSRVDRARSGGKRVGAIFLLTGSANVWGSLQVSESLAGRAERVQLWSLSQGEILGRAETFVDDLFAGKPPAIESAPTGRESIASAVVRGGYPEMLARGDTRRQSRWIANYVQMIVERDARDLAAGAQRLDELPRLLAAAAARVCGLLDIAELARDTQLGRDTSRRYLTLLELLFLVRRAPAWSRNLGQRLIKAPKLWFPDSGLASHLIGYDESRLRDDDTALAGSLFENFVASEVTKQASWADAEPQLHHFRTAGGREIDIVLETRDGRVAGIEAKLTTTPRKRDFAGLEYLREKLGERFRAGVVVHTGPQTLPFGDRLWAVPTSALWTPAERTP
jgi:predicted AAA+ superfamily ATPase